MKKKPAKQLLAGFFVITIGFILPVILIVKSVQIFNKTSVLKKIVEKKEKTEEVELTPSQILNNQQKYRQQRLIIEGRVSPEPAVCEQKECPPGDPCCGCPEKKDLVIIDAGVVLTTQTENRLKLLDSEGNSFCRRLSSRCQYDCGDWGKGATYKVSGLFYVQPAPPGWRYSLNFYFQVEEAQLVKKFDLKESVGVVLNEIWQMIKKIRDSSYYILP